MELKEIEEMEATIVNTLSNIGQQHAKRARDYGKSAMARFVLGSAEEIRRVIILISQIKAMKDLVITEQHKRMTEAEAELKAIKSRWWWKIFK